MGAGLASCGPRVWNEDRSMFAKFRIMHLLSILLIFLIKVTAGRDEYFGMKKGHQLATKRMVTSCGSKSILEACGKMGFIVLGRFVQHAVSLESSSAHPGPPL